MKRRALVTGATRGIGAAIAAILVDDGYEVFAGSSSPDGRVPPGSIHLPSDLGNPEETERFAAHVATLDLDVLVNNAGINKIGLLESYDPADFVRLQQVNVLAPFLLCRAVVPAMRRRRYGRILNITSIWGVVSRAGRAAYSATKSALGGLSRALALEVAADNVLVNCLAPGVVETELTRQTLGERGIAELRREIPVGRLASPQEIAQVARFLVSEANTYLTGQVIVVDGGFTSG